MNAEFSKSELELLANGFGFYVQEFPLPEDDSAHELLAKLYSLIEQMPNDVISG